MAMKLLTKQILSKLPRESAIENLETEEMKVVVKFFHPWAGWRWYAVSGNPLADGDMEFFGITSSPDGKSWGYFFLSDLESVNAQRDKLFKPCLSVDVMEGHVR